MKCAYISARHHHRLKGFPVPDGIFPSHAVREVADMNDNVPAVSRGRIASGLRELGLGSGDSVLVHSSLSSFGYVEGGADAVIDALLDAVGPGGNVLVPTLTGTRHDGPDRPPVFDVRSTPCWTGRIPSTLMARPGARRSLHPTHSVAGIGPDVENLIAGHEDAPTPCGRQSPYYKLAEQGGYILLLGVGQDSNTTLHTAEELAEVPYHLQPEPTDAVVIDYAGRRHVKRMYLHDWGTPRAFSRIDASLLELGIMRVGTIGKATVRLIRSLALLDWLVPVLQQDNRFLCKKV